jgi:hypothetical protein
VDVNLLGALHNAAIDPGFARLLGFGDVDETMAGPPVGEVAAYVVRGCGTSRRAARQTGPPADAVDALVPRGSLNVRCPRA